MRANWVDELGPIFGPTCMRLKQYNGSCNICGSQMDGPALAVPTNNGNGHDVLCELCASTEPYPGMTVLELCNNSMSMVPREQVISTRGSIVVAFCSWCNHEIGCIRFGHRVVYSNHRREYGASVQPNT